MIAAIRWNGKLGPFRFQSSFWQSTAILGEETEAKLYGFRTNSGSLAMFAPILRASVP